MNKKVLDHVNSRTPFCCERQLLLQDHECEGRITREHALIYGGSKIDEPWAIVLLCAKAHNVDEFYTSGCMDKRINEWIAINRMTPEIEARFRKVDWCQKRRWLNGKYGTDKLDYY